jgi:HSP20 family molecular chaperone IbpA
MSTQTQQQQDTSPDMSDWPGSPLPAPHHDAPAALAIRTEDYLRNGRYVIRFELPGINPGTGLDVNIAGQVLTVHAERQPDLTGVYHSEFRYGQFCGQVSLPAGVDDEDVTATYAAGVLELSLRMEDEQAARTIKIATDPALRR